MANLKSKKEVWMNALRQTKEYKYLNSPSDCGGEYTVPYCEFPDPSEYDGDIHQEDLDKAAAEGSKEFWPEDRKDKRNAYHKQHIERDYVEEAKIEIVDKVTKHFLDTVFEMICEEMGNKYVFQSSNYLTEAGMDEFEEQFFEFYHEHHGDIMGEVMKNITNG